MKTSQTRMRCELFSRILDRWRSPLRRIFFQSIVCAIGVIIVQIIPC